jgi:hypothetical protein
MTQKTCHWYLSVSGHSEPRLAHFCASLSSTTIFSKEDEATATAFCCGKHVTAPQQNCFFGNRLPREEQKRFRAPLSAMRREETFAQ